VPSYFVRCALLIAFAIVLCTLMLWTYWRYPLKLLTDQFIGLWLAPCCGRYVS